MSFLKFLLKNFYFLGEELSKKLFLCHEKKKIKMVFQGVSFGGGDSNS